MNRRNPILIITSVVLVFFLFTPIILRSLHTDLERYSKSIGIAKSSPTPAKADSQMLFEEKEKEVADNSIDHLPLIYILSEYISYKAENTPSYPDVQASGFFGSIPLYIAKRSILI